MTDSVRPRKCCPLCGSVSVRKCVLHKQGYRCDACGRYITPEIRDVAHGKKGTAQPKVAVEVAA